MIIAANVLVVIFLDQRQSTAAERAAVEAQAAALASRYALTRAGLTAAVRHEALRLAESDELQLAVERLPRSDGESRWLFRMGDPASGDQPVIDARWRPAPDIALADWRAAPQLVAYALVPGTPSYLGAAVDIRSVLRDDADSAQFSLIADAPRVSQAALGPDRLVLDRSNGLALVMGLGAAPSNTARMSLLAIAAMNAVLLGLLTMVGRWLYARGRRAALSTAVAPLNSALMRARRGDPDASLSLPPGHALAELGAMYNAVVMSFSDRLHDLEHQHKYDALTGLATRAEVRERIGRAVERADASGGTLAAVVMDLARFGEINNTFGHEAGDHVLRALARRLSRVTRVGDIAARVGGDEFMLLLADVDTPEAQAIVQVLIDKLEEPVELHGRTLQMQVHAGVAMYPEHCDSARSLRRTANIALMAAKEAREPCAVFEPGQDEQHLRELAIIHDLPGALRDGELYLQYQPKIDMASQQVEVVEALVRWRHPQLGFVPPDEFIGLLERAGQIAPLTRWVFNEAIRQCREWMDAGYAIGVAINISANDLLDETLAAQVVERLRHYAVEPARVSIEVTESAVIADPERAIGVLNDFRRAGIRIALDDFGTGQSSLSLIKQLPLSQIKIDKTFVQHLRANSGDAIIVKSIIDLGHNMGLLVTAEGVESNYCWNLLNAYNCDLVQGYLVSAPLTSDELRTWYLKLQKRHVTRLDFEAAQGAG